MRTTRNILTVLLVTLAMTGCTRKARLYNLTTGEVTNAEFSYGGSGKGKIKAVAPSGEQFQGEYRTLTKGQLITWGGIYDAVYNTGGATQTNSTKDTNGSAQYGTAIISGNQGTVVECEYVVAFIQGGHGGCRDNQGVLYKLMF